MRGKQAGMDIKKKKEKKPSGKNISSVVQLKNGSFSLAVTAIVLAIIVVINLIIGQLPSKLLNWDLSETGIFSVSDTSKELLKDLDKDVTVEVVAETGNVDSRIEKFISIYGDLSSKLKVSYVDPVLHPEILTKYGISANSVVVSCEETGKNQVISFSDIIVSQQNYYGYSSESEFDAEGQLTSAVAAVTSDNDKKIYLLRGHGESTISQELGELLTKNSMTTSNLNLLETASVPDDCDLLIINNPTSDLGTDEYTELHNYLYQGGNVLLLRGVTDKELTNFNELMEDYGMTMVNSYIGDRDRYYQRAQSAFYFFPMITSNDTNVETTSSILVGAVAGMTASENTPEDVTLTTLLTTSNNAFREGNSNEATQFILAASAQKTVPADTESESELESGSDTKETEKTSAESVSEEDSTESVTENASEEVTSEAASEAESTEESTLEDVLTDISVGNTDGWLETPSADSKLTVISASTMIDSSLIGNFTGIENLNEFINIVSSYFDDVQNVSIPAKSLSVTYNTVTGSSIWNALFIIVIPVFSIVAGLVVWIRRRKA